MNKCNYFTWQGQHQPLGTGWQILKLNSVLSRPNSRFDRVVKLKTDTSRETYKPRPAYTYISSLNC